MATSQIFLCSTIKNRAGNLKRLCKSFAAMQNTGPCRVVVADFASDDADLSAILATLPMPATLVTMRGVPFNRSQGLNYAARFTDAKPNDILFFLDVDLLVPANLPALLRQHVKAGHGWFPVVYSLHKGKPAVELRNSRKPKIANGWWRFSGKGTCGFTQDDFKKIKGWCDELGVTWGREDGDIAKRAQDAGIRLTRNKCVDLFHVWHPGGSYKTKYHRYQTRPKGKVIVAKPTISIWKSDF